MKVEGRDVHRSWTAEKQSDRPRRALSGLDFQGTKSGEMGGFTNLLNKIMVLTELQPSD